jgi:hypothetical protein
VVKEYIETVNASNAGVGAGDDQNGADQNKVLIQLDTNKYPIAPKITTDKKMKKNDLEQLYRLYLTHHYRESLKSE